MDSPYQEASTSTACAKPHQVKFKPSGGNVEKIMRFEWFDVSVLAAVGPPVGVV